VVSPEIIMAGLGLVHLGFLAAAAAVAVPVLIHLLLRPRARRMEIGSLRFLKLVLRDSSRRRKLRRWLLLALRCAAVLLLALLFARPYLQGANKEGREREILLLIDQSASMATVQGDQTLFAKALEAAEQVLRRQPDGTATQFAYFDAQGVTPAENNRLDRNRSPGFAAGDYHVALRWARDRLLVSSRPVKQVYLFTDLQRSGLRGSPSEAFPPTAAVEIVEVGSRSVANLAVEAVETPQAILRPDQPIVVAATLANLGALPARNVTVRLALEGGGARHEETQTVMLPGATRQVVRFTPPLKKPGVYAGKVEIAGDDGFPLDNRRWLAFEVRPADRLLVVDGEPSPSVYGNETYYLETALRLRLPNQKESLSPYEPERLAWADNASLPDLAPYRAVILCNVPTLSAGDVNKLQKFVAAGGGLLVFTGGKVRPEGYELLQRAGLVPAKVEGEAGPDVFRFQEWDRSHPILGPLSDPQQGDLRRVTFHHMTRLKPAENAKVLATAPGGHPLLIEGRLDKGTVLLFATAADRDWGDWPQGRLYVPLVHQLLGYLTERLPENQRVQTAPVGPGDTNPPGVTTTGRMVVVRNLDPRESDIERLTVKQFREAFRLADGEETTRAPVEPLPGSERSDEIWMYVLLVLLGVLVLELFVANRSHG
jgi:Aerotolerance regulator N-terminal